MADESGDPKNANPKRFLPQCFLMDFYKTFAATNLNYGYKTLTKLTANPTYSMNKLMDKKDSFSINDLTPAQFAMLMPTFRLSKVYEDDTEFEFLFEDYTSVESITRGSFGTGLRLSGRGKPNAVGFKSFSWDDEGSNPANTGMIFKAELKLVAVDIASLFYDTGENPPFSELLQQDSSKKKADINPEFDVKKSTIRVDVGWKLSPSLAKSSLLGANSKRIKEAIANSKITLFLSLMTHELNIKEDGSIEITISYKARTNAALSSPAANVLYIGKEAQAFQDRARKWIPDLEDKLAETKAKLKEAEDVRYLKLQRLNDWSDFRRDAKRKFGVHDTPEIDDLEEEAKYYERQLKETKAENESREQDKKFEIYAKLLTDMIKAGRLFYIDLSSKQLELLKKLTAVYTNKDLDAKQIIKRRALILKNAAMFDGTSTNPVRRRAGMPPNVGEQIRTAAAQPADDGFMGTDRSEMMENLGTQFDNNAKLAKSLDDGRINFFFLGDILEAAFKVVRQSQIDEKDKRLVNYLVGSVDILDFETGKFVPLNLADVPICYEYFTSWFFKKVIQPQMGIWNIRSFIRDVVSDLVVNSLSPVCFGKALSKYRISINTTVIDLPNQKGRPALPRGRTPQSGYIKKSTSDSYTSGIYKRIGDLPIIKLSKNWKKATEFSHYLYMYAAGFTSAHLKGNYQEDKTERGILHLLIGSDRGLLKGVSFKRVDQPGQMEVNMSKAAKGGAVANQLFSNRYNVDLTLFGNTLFKPGMLIYLDTTVLGIGKSSDPNSAAAKMGLGGYFRVIKCGNVVDDGKFETSLECILECYGKDDAPDQAGVGPDNPQDPTKLTPSEPGIGSIIGL